MSEQISGKVMSVVVGVVGAVIALILLLVIMGNASIIAQINSGLTAICDSGWPLASLFNSESGIVPLLIIVGIFIGAIVLAIGVGISAYKKGK